MKFEGASTLSKEYFNQESFWQPVVPIANYGISFLDDALGGIYPSDLILLGAKSGCGKTELVSIIAESLASKEIKVCLIALEAEETEIQRRIAYRHFVNECKKEPILWSKLKSSKPSYSKYIARKLDHIIDLEVQKQFKRPWADFLSTTYRSNEGFDIEKLDLRLTTIMKTHDVVILDHIHYVDVDEEKQNAELKKVIQVLRSHGLKNKKPIIVVGHLRKSQISKSAPLVPELEDFHGSSDLGKIATKAIVIAPCHLEELASPNYFRHPTFFQILKNRMDGSSLKYTGVLTYDSRENQYANEYAIGKLNINKTGISFLKAVDAPNWVNLKNLKEAQNDL